MAVTSAYIYICSAIFRVVPSFAPSGRCAEFLELCRVFCRALPSFFRVMPRFVPSCAEFLRDVPSFYGFAEFCAELCEFLRSVPRFVPSCAEFFKAVPSFLPKYAEFF